MKLFALYLSLLFCPLVSFSQGGWLYANLVSSNNRLEDVYFVNKDTGFAVDFGGFIYKTVNAGASWDSTSFATLATFRSIEFLSDGVTGIAGSLFGNIYRTADGGNSWQNITGAFANAGGICGLAHNGDNFYAVGWWGADTAKIFKSTDKGVTWNTTALPPSLVTNLVDAVFLTKDTGFITGGKNTLGVNSASSQAIILKTTDGGGTWTRVFMDSVIGGRIWKIQALTHNTLVAAIEPYYKDTVAMVRSTDGGNTWTLIGTGFHVPGGFPGLGAATTQGIGFVTEQRGWLGGYYIGMIETLDAGATWHHANIGYNLNRFFIIDSMHAYAGGLHLYKYLGDTTHTSGVIPHAIKPPHDLYPVYPNPSKGNVKIEFELKTETNVVLEVANTDSRSISRIVSKRMKPGHYTYYWDGRNAPNGHYIIWLGTDEIPITQRFVLER